MKSVMSNDVVQFVEGFAQSIACFIGGMIIYEKLGIFILIPVVSHILSTFSFGFYGIVK